MSSVRQSKISRLLQKELSEIFQQKALLFLPGGMITVTIVRVAPDLSVAKIFLSIFPTKQHQEVMNNIIEAKKMIRHELGLRIKKQIRIVPELAFYLDDSCDYLENIERLLKS
ncbi:MAG TPA: 30S ribosome-binding factor RbfA [Bacteroidales bacterium]|nr:MAG: ribosome-binding factor A [Bacteroidetes bacterium GWF2_33_38]OFY92020.1 MAG: ribosome-binding factor A [Bacteroidetes bacterium RIFOXYA2_FULL_33_7]HBF89467.1 30S ribosome-binding factor RbfA [Bacteroidales bacterium]